MPLPDTELLARAYQARDKLVEQFLNRPEVSLIDIGYDLENLEKPRQIVVRVHVRRATTRQSLGLPEEIDGIPVWVVIVNYRPEWWFCN